MPDNPNPDTPHQHLYWNHHLEHARATAALWPPQPPVTIVRVLCRAGTTLGAAAGPKATDHTSR